MVSYDSGTGEWVIIRSGTFDGKYQKKRLITVCDFYKWGDHEMVTGPHACDLRVGELIVSNHPNPDAQGKYPGFVDIWEMSAERLSITRGDGPDQAHQQFVILKSEVLPEN